MTLEQRIQRQAELDRRHGELTRLATRNFCAQCNGVLVVAWLGGDYELVCGQDHSHIGVKSWREHPQQKEKEAQQMVVDKVGTEKGAELIPYARQAALTEAEAKKVLVALWPKAPPAEIVKAALICRDYGLNPLMKHIFLVPFNEGKSNESWAVILSIHATRLLARRRGAYSYVDDTPRLMTEDEQKRRFGEVDTKNYWAITKLAGYQGNLVPGYGNYPKERPANQPSMEFPYGASKGNTPQKMAFIRSERDALDRLYPGELPALEVADVQYVDAVVVNGKTGEILAKREPRPGPGQEPPPGVAEAMEVAGIPPQEPTASDRTTPRLNGPGSKATPAQLRAIETAALHKGYAYPQGLEGQLAQADGYPQKVADLTVAQASKVIEWLNGKGNL